MHIFTDRSRIEAGQKCPRYRYWHYHYKGQGIQAAREIPPPWALLTGTWTHWGIEHILNGMSPADAAIHAAGLYTTEMVKLFTPIPEGEVLEGLIRDRMEQTQLVKAMVYAWGVSQYPAYLDQYEPAADGVEQEETITFHVGEDEVTLLTRTDLLSRYKGGDNHVIHNFKTVSSADKTWREQWRYDQQTLTEFIAVENRIGKQIVGTIIQGLIKGRRAEYPEGSGIWHHSSPLVWLWYRQGEPPMTADEFYGRYAWTCKEPHMTAGKRSKECPGGVSHRLSGVHKAAAEDVYPGGIIAWIDYLMREDPELVRNQFVTLEPISRSEFEVERWKRQVLAREIGHVQAAQVVEAMELVDPVEAAGMLDYHFPMVTGHGNCLRPSECAMKDVCWGTADPDDMTKFKLRSPNHPAEVSG